jgi:hypothetical protein
MDQGVVVNIKVVIEGDELVAPDLPVGRRGERKEQ